MVGEAASGRGDPSYSAGHGVFGDERVEEAQPATKPSAFPNRYDEDVLSLFIFYF